MLNAIMPGGLTYYAPEGSGRIVFRGLNGTEAEEFVYMVRLRALAVRKVRDKDWMADYAGSCFIGNALRWYGTLEEEIQSDWNRLYRAILQQYPPSEVDEEQQSRYMAPYPLCCVGIDPKWM